MKKAAFTLIELLVVIAIIAILAGIALPVFQKAAERGRAVQDLNNLKSIGVAVQAYLNDSGDTMLNKVKSNPPWPQQLTPLTTGSGGANYLGDLKALVSPFDKRGFTGGTATATVSYGINQLVFAATDPNTSSYNHTTQLILFAPAMDDKTDITFSGQASQNVFVTATNKPTPARGTHSGRRLINVLFADSHAEAIKWNDFTDSKSTDGNLRWNPTAP